MHEDNPHRTRRHVKLPGGRQIEVVYLDGASKQLDEAPSYLTQPATDSPIDQRSARASATAPGDALHVCPRCTGGLVHPLDWAEESPGRWRILMRCPDCDALREGVFGQTLVERLDEELDKATGALLSDLRQLTHANMVEEIEVFSRALELDLIGPSDF